MNLNIETTFLTCFRVFAKCQHYISVVVTKVRIQVDSSPMWTNDLEPDGQHGTVTFIFTLRAFSSI